MIRATNFVHRVLLLSVLLVLVLSSLNLVLPFQDHVSIGEVAAVLESSDPIVIDGDFDLAAHSTVKSGSGTTLDPYIISDYSIDATSSGRGGIAIRNTTKHLLIRNITVQVASTATGVLLYPKYSGGWKAMNIILENITITGGSPQIYMYVPILVTIKGCTFNNPSLSGNVIHSVYGYWTNIFNSTFNCPNMDVNLDYSTYIGFTENRGILRRYDHLNFRYSNFANNTLNLNSARLYSGYFSDFQGNELIGRSSSENLLYIVDCNRMKIANNTLQGGYDTIYVSHPNIYSPVRTNYPKWASLRFEYNHINGSANRGIYFYYTTGHPTITYVNILYNRFTNCTSFAISVLGGGHASTVIWHNSFENNHGSGDTFSAGTVQARDRYGQFSWDNGMMGNYWKDKKAPDDDSDGFVDDPYPQDSFSTSTDQFPVSNPYFDFEKPQLEILNPRGRFQSGSYINLSWDVSDDLSGMKKMEIRVGFQPWINVSARDHHGLFLVAGSYNLKFRATDNALLRTEIEIDIVVNNTVLPFEVTSPIEGEFYNTSSIGVGWVLDKSFVPLNLSYSLDRREYVEMDQVEPFNIDVAEGEHTLDIRFFDHYGNELLKRSVFTCDTTDPVVSILYPAQGSVITNDLVNFEWEQSDEFGISAMLVRIDGGPLVEKENPFFSELLSNGPHSLQVIVLDLAGNSDKDVLSFVISRNTSLNIITPRLMEPTSIQKHLVQWEYLTANLDVESLSIILDNQDPLPLSPSITHYEMFLPIDGLHRITVRAFDPAGNIVSDTVEVILDRTSPAPDFQFPSDGSFFNQTNLDLKWNAVEKWGIDHFDLYVDDILKASDLKQGAFSVDLLMGGHVLRIIAYDLAGNVGEKEITITIDTVRPKLSLLEPSGDILTELYITFRWEGEDEYGIDYYNFTLDDRPVEEVGLATSRQLSMTEGSHLFILRCVDQAGNVRLITKRFTVDQNDPVVTFKTDLPDHITSFNGLLEWEIIEEVGVSSIDLTINGIEYQVSSDARYFITELEKGKYEIVILVTDISGRSDEETLIFTIDPDPPAVHKNDDGVSIDGSKAVVYWVLEEEKDNLTRSLFLDGNPVSVDIDLEDGLFLFAELASGNHTVLLHLVDKAGNEKDLVWEFIIEEEKGDDPSSTGLGARAVIIIVLVIFLVIGTLASFYFYKKKAPKEEEKRIEAPKRPEKLSFGPTPHHVVRVAPVHHRAHHVGKAPPIHAQGASKGHEVKDGYIRPETTKKIVQRTILDAPPHKERSVHATPVKKEQTKHPSEDKVSKKMEPLEDLEEWDSVEDWGDGDEIDEWDEMEEL